MEPRLDERVGVDKPAPSSPISRVIGPPVSALEPTPVENPRMGHFRLYQGHAFGTLTYMEGATLAV